ncbi:MAG: hypothetical protein HYZ57_15935, partial [Acidobacteria bacterium]|nr:hypothetical protein [Acidobacteriota bacterium]
MPETLTKLRPDRDLQCYFERPSAIAALSETGADRFTVSGTWRQQFDWVVIEWNRDNVFEHPLLRNLPDADLSGIQLSYEETRTNCIPLDSSLYPTVDWPVLRVWASSGGAERLYNVPLKNYATPVLGGYTCASADFELSGPLTPGDYVGLAWTGEHHTYQIYGSDTVDSVVQAIVDSVNAFSPVMRAEKVAASVRLFYVGTGQTLADSTTGHNGNRVGVYSYVSGAGAQSWDKPWATLSGGTSPSKWHIQLNFADLHEADGTLVPAASIRKMRWTYAADLQAGAFGRSEFAVNVTNWTVTGTNLAYKAAGPGSRRFEDGADDLQYSGAWTRAMGNFSGGFIRHTIEPGASVSCAYLTPQAHKLYLGTRGSFNASQITFQLDGVTVRTEDLNIPGEDVLRRVLVGDVAAGSHTLTVTHAGPAGNYFYFDFVEIVIPADTLPDLPEAPRETLATDWDTDHSIALAPERTAWLISKLGFKGRHNYYTGALWFYELVRDGHQYASATVQFAGTPEPSTTAEIRIGRLDQPPETVTVLQHLNHVGDTAATVARAFEMEINSGYTAIRAELSGTTLAIYSRGMGADGNNLTVSASPAAGAFTLSVSSATFSGGTNGTWLTDTAAMPRLNRAVRDWSRSFFRALAAQGVSSVAAAFSMELQHGDPSLAAGLVQRYPSGNPVALSTPAVQTNFSPTSRAFWKQVYLEMAQVQQEAAIVPYLQFGEVQWWYFPYDGSGLPYYDAYTADRFRAEYGRDMAVITTNTTDPAAYPDEAAFLARLVGEFTAEVMTFVRASYPACRFEVLYPPDVNEAVFNRAVNYPAADWTPAALDCLKTESFTYTYSRNLDLSLDSMTFGDQHGFPRSQRAHL